MKIIIKNLKQVQYPININNDKITVKELKEEFCKVHNQFEASSLKFLYHGLILNDEKTLSDYKLKDEDVLIMMVTKSHIIHNNKPEIGNEEIKESEKQKSKDQEKSKEKEKEKEKKKEKEYPNELKQLREMGFDKETSEKALKISKGNLQSAIELAMNGITDEDLAFFEEQEQQNQNHPNNIPSLKTIASVIKVLCQNDPTNLEDILQTLQQNAPELMNMISNNQEEFENLLKEPMNENDLRNFEQFQIENGELFGLGEEDEEDDNDGINLTKDEMDKVKKIVEFTGVSEAEAVQAFIACEKNEQLATNFVLENKYGNDSMDIECKIIFI